MLSGDGPIDYQRIFDPVDNAKEIWGEAPDASFANEQAEAIFKEILPAVLSRFVRKNADYGTYAAFLGTKGQFSDLNRKYWKLKRALWDGEELIGESIEEICSDLIGHCLLTLLFLDIERKEKQAALSEHVKEVDAAFESGNFIDPNNPGKPEGHGLRS